MALSSTVEWDVEGRKVRVSDVSAFDPRVKQRAMAVIQQASRDEHVFEHFPRMLILLQDAVPGTQDPAEILRHATETGKVDEASALRELPVLSVFIDAIWASAARKQASFDEELRGTVRHELEHLFTFRENDALKARTRALKQLDQVLDGCNRDLAAYVGAQDAMAAMNALRKELYRFVNLLLLEGTAKYAERFHGMSISLTSLALMQARGEHAARELLAELDRRSTALARGQLQAGNLAIYSYDMGLAMVYTVLFAHQGMTLTQVEQMSPLKFLKLYEESALAWELSVLASYTSSRGLFDYKRETERWWQAAQSASLAWGAQRPAA
jgi:hypothetical protein